VPRLPCHDNVAANRHARRLLAVHSGVALDVVHANRRRERRSIIVTYGGVNVRLVSRRRRPDDDHAVT
jgi:hypothetical protein